MPRRLLQAPGHKRSRSLGWLAVWWIETFTVRGPGPVVGLPVRYGDETTGFIVDCYALDERGRSLYDSAFYSRPKGCDKSGKAAALALFEALGPARFDGWAKGGEVYEFLGRSYVYAAGEPMGKVVVSPFVRIMATEEEQAGNVYKTIHHNLSDERAPLFELQAYGVQVGLGRILLPWGGEIRPSTAGAASKDGGSETFAVFDETHLYNRPVLREMYDTVANNLIKRKASTGTWYIETTTMYLPGEDSIAERTYSLADATEEGRTRRSRLLFDHSWGEVVDMRDEDELERGFTDAYGEALDWNSLEDLVNGAFDPRRAEARTRRLFLNSLTSADNAWVQVDEWSARNVITMRRKALEAGEPWLWMPPARGDRVTLGFDGARSDDATALIACRVSDRHVFPIQVWETPDGPEAIGYEVDREAVDAAVARAFDRYDVVGFYADPPYWQDYVDAWAKEYGDRLLVHAGAKHSLNWYTKNDVPMAAALDRLHEAILDGTMTHSGHLVTTRHFLNARRWPRRGGVVIGKERKGSPKKIDAAVAAALAFQAAADLGAKKKPDEKKTESVVPFAVR